MTTEAPAAARRRSASVDEDEIARFAALADAWWREDGAFRALHRLNPVRLAYLRDHLCRRFALDARSLTPFTGLDVLDLGCGGGLLSEPLARLGARLVAADAEGESVAAAAHHAAAAGLEIDYRQATAEELAEAGESFDAVVSLEVLEHVADLDAFLAAAAALVRPGGALVLATLNRTLKSYALAIVGAEYVLGWLPRGTHDWNKFIKPSELGRCLRAAGLALEDVSGVGYDPLAGEWRLGRDVAVNYMAFATKP